MTAKEARELSTSVTSTIATTQLADIYPRIKAAANRGDTAIAIEGRPFHAAVKEKLIADGYKVTFHSDQRDNGSSNTISW